MGHEIDMSNGQANVAYVGQKPWHGLGQELKQGASIDQWRVAAGMDFEVLKAPVMYETEKGDKFDVNNRFVMYRNDTGGAVGVASRRYKPVQPAEILEFYRDLVGKSGMELETAGVLKGGALYWALARTGDSMKVHGSTKDIVDGYILLATANDGSMATKAKFTSVRVVCNNTLTMASNRDQASEIRVPHYSNFNAEAVKVDLGISHDIFGDFQENVNLMADKNVTRKQEFNILADLYYPKRDKTLDETAKLLHVYRTLELVDDSAGSSYKSAKGTLWGTLNGVTNYLDHERKAQSVDTRMRSAWFGTGEAFKNNMWQMALDRIGKAEKIKVAA